MYTHIDKILNYIFLGTPRRYIIILSFYPRNVDNKINCEKSIFI